MRRRLAAALIVPALMLTAACGESDDSGKTKDAAASQSPEVPEVPKPVTAADPMPAVAGEPGKKPAITVPKGDPSGKFVVATLTEGTGPVVQKNDLVVTKYTGKVWKSDKELAPGSYDQGGTSLVVTAGAPTMLPMFSESVTGKKVGSRLLVVAPPSAAFGEQGKQELGVAPTDNLVFVLDIAELMPKKAEGTQASIPADLPQIKADKNEAAEIKIPKNDPPKELVSKVLIEGKGPEVKNGQTVYMQYSGAAWKVNEGKDKATLFDTSWKTGAPFSTVIGQGQVIEGWDKGLVGKKVGDRVLLVIPPAQAYKDQDKGPELPANSTLVFVVDIVGAM